MAFRYPLLMAVMTVLSWTAAFGDDAARPARVLFVTQSKGFVHGSVKRNERELAPAEIALTQLGQQTGLFTVHCTQECEADFTKKNLQNYDIVAFYTTGDLPIAEEDLVYFYNDWLKQKGHGVLGFHSAADTFHNDPRYYEMIGGTFISHPWGSGHTVTLVNHDPKSPLAEAFGQDFVIKDEIYMYRNWQPKNVHLLLSLDYSRSKTESPVNVAHGYHVPVSWAREWGNGRIYFNNLGHNEGTWTNAAFLKSITNAVRWIRGQEQADVTPNPAVSAEQEKKAQRDAAEHGFTTVPGVIGQVSGIVTLNGKPLAGAAVEFHPQGSGPASTGVTNAEGKYTLKIDGKANGAIVGQHRVSISADGEKSGGAAAIPAKYADEQSALRADVQRGRNEFHFELKAP